MSNPPTCDPNCPHTHNTARKGCAICRFVYPPLAVSLPTIEPLDTESDLLFLKNTYGAEPTRTYTGRWSISLDLPGRHLSVSAPTRESVISEMIKLLGERNV